MSSTKKGIQQKTPHGGARKGAGRKPASDPKVSVTIYVEESIVKANGGIENVKDICYSFLKKGSSKT